MSSIEYLREFVNERLTVAAEEIFSVFSKTIVEYEEEIDRQRKLLDAVWKPEIQLHRIELPQQHVCKEEEEEEALSDQQLCIQERNSSLDQEDQEDQEDSESPQIKEEQEELYISQEGEQLELKQETETFMLTPTDAESYHSEDQTLDLNPDKSQSVAETDLPASICISWIKDESDLETPVVPQPNSAHQLLFHNFHVAESQDQREGKNGDSGSMSYAETKPQTSHHKHTSQENKNNPTIDTRRDNPYSCQICGKDFGCNSNLLVHMRAHTGEKPYSCNTCGKKYCRISDLKIHIRNHTGEKPYSCNTCGKTFTKKSVLNSHIRIHSGEKPFACKTCGKDFICISYLRSHMRVHTGEKPYSCKICGKEYRFSSNLIEHIRTHTGEKPYLCKTCGKDFNRNSDLLVHIRRAHTGEKPYLCKICGKRYCDASHLAKHIRSHKDKQSYL